MVLDLFIKLTQWTRRSLRRPENGEEPTKKGSTQARFMMAISFDRRIVMCEQSKSITSLEFVKTMDNCLPKTFDLNINPMTDGLLRTEMLAKTLQCAKKLWKI